MKIKESDKDRIVKLREDGLSYRAIGRHFNCSGVAVMKRLKAWNTETEKIALQKQIRKKVKFLMDKEKNEVPLEILCGFYLMCRKILQRKSLSRLSK